MNNKHDDKLRELFFGSAQNNFPASSANKMMEMITTSRKRKKLVSRRENIVMISYIVFVILVSAALALPGDITRAFLQTTLTNLKLSPVIAPDMMIYYQFAIGLVVLSFCFLGAYLVKMRSVRAK
jgi:hypothetical protein